MKQYISNDFTDEIFKEALINSQSPIIHVFSCNTAS